MAKVKEHYEGYIQFYRNNNRWCVSVYDDMLVPGTGVIQWKITIPVPDELCVEEFPEKVKVRRVEMVAA